MTSRIRLFLLIELAVFVFAVLVHVGALFDGYEHMEARIAEAIIAIVLLAGLVLSWLRPADIRTIGLWAQGVGLVVTLIGAFTIVIGVGPDTALDITMHVIMLALFIVGIGMIARSSQRSVA